MGTEYITLENIEEDFDLIQSKFENLRNIPVTTISNRYLDEDGPKYFDVDKNGGVSRYIDFYLIGELVDSHGNVHYEDLKNLPTADVPQWIPCNEELPKCDGDYLVTLDFEWGKEIEMGEWFCGEWINPNSHVTVAWMPLPNPWKGEEDEQIL